MDLEGKVQFSLLFPNDTSQHPTEHKQYKRPDWVKVTDIGKVTVGYQPKQPIDSNIKRKEKKPVPEPPRHIKIIADAVATVFILIVSIAFLALFIIGCFVLAGKLI